MSSPGSGDDLRRRAAVAGVALACALVGLGVSMSFGMGSGEFVGLGGVWASLALALALEPDPRGPRWRAAVAVVVAALLGAALGLWGAARDLPQWWYSSSRQNASLGLLAACAAWVGAPFPGVLVVATALLPGPALLLAVRRARRQLEWQAGAAAAAVVFAALALAPSDLDHAPRLLGLVISGLPPGFGMYLLDRRALGATLPSFPTDEVASSRRARGLLLLGGLGGLAWSLVAGQIGPGLIPVTSEPGCPDMPAVLEDVRARQAAHVARVGAPARSLGALAGLPADVAGGCTQGYVLRYGRLDGARWVLAADPVPARLGWPSLRLVGPDGVIERSVVALRLEAP